MHSETHRLNALLSFAGLPLSFLLATASFLDGFNSPTVQAHAHVFVFLDAEYQTPKNSINQGNQLRAAATSWEHFHQTSSRNLQHIPLSGRNLCGKNIELVLHWHVMAKTCKMIRDKMLVSNFTLPEAYS